MGMFRQLPVFRCAGTNTCDGFSCPSLPSTHCGLCSSGLPDRVCVELRRSNNGRDVSVGDVTSRWGVCAFPPNVRGRIFSNQKLEVFVGRDLARTPQMGGSRNPDRRDFFRCPFCSVSCTKPCRKPGDHERRVRPKQSRPYRQRVDRVTIQMAKRVRAETVRNWLALFLSRTRALLVVSQKGDHTKSDRVAVSIRRFHALSCKVGF